MQIATFELYDVENHQLVVDGLHDILPATIEASIQPDHIIEDIHGGNI